MRIAVMGAGGVGAYVGARLQAAGENVVYIARGAHLAALRADGLRIEAPQAGLHLPKVVATDDPAQVGAVDLVLFTVKLWDTEDAARSLAPLLAPHTRVVTLQNGIDSVALLARHVPPAQVVGGVIYLSAVISRPGVIRSPGGMHRILVDAAAGDATVAAFCAACARATAIEATTSADVGRTIWEKFIALAAISGATALLRSSTGPIVDHPESHAFLRALIDEGVAVAAAVGHAMPAGFADATMARIAAMPPQFRSSMAEDLERGKPLELRWLSGRMHGLGLEHGVATPSHTAVYRGLVLHAGPAAPAPARQRLPAIPPADYTPEQKAAAAEFEAARKVPVFGPFEPLMYSPQVMSQARAMGDYLRYRSAIGNMLSELAILVTAREWSQDYEWHVHRPIALERGIAPAIADAIAQGRRPEGMSDDEDIVYEFSIELHRTRHVSDLSFARAEKRFGRQGVVDLTAINAYYALLAMQLNMAQYPLPEGGRPLPRLP